MGQAILWAPNTQSEPTTPRKYYPKNSNPVLGHPFTAHQLKNFNFFNCIRYFYLVALLGTLKTRKMSLSVVLKDFVESLGTYQNWGSRGKTSGETKRIIKSIKQLLDVISGGDSKSLLLAAMGRPMLLTTSIPSGLSGFFDNLSLPDKRSLLQVLCSSGWGKTELASSGITVGKDLWKNKDAKVDVGGRPTVVTPDMKGQVKEEHLVASSSTSIKLIRESRKRGEAVTVENMMASFRAVYDNSPLKDSISYSVYRSLRGVEFQKLRRRTDVCNYCLTGKNLRNKLASLTSSVFTTCIWDAGRRNGWGLWSLLMQQKSLPTHAKPNATKYIKGIIEVDSHIEEVREQCQVYREHTSDPGDHVIMTLDYKEKGKLPLMPEEPNSLFYQQGKYSLLGCVLHEQIGTEVKRSHIDFLLPHINQDAVVTYLVLQKFFQTYENTKNIHFWADAGKHFQNKTIISSLMQNKQISSVNFFPGRHGKSECDRHFGNVTAALTLASKSQEIRTLQNVGAVIERMVSSTTAVYTRFRNQQIKVTEYSISDLTSISCFQRATNNNIYVSPLSGTDPEDCFELQLKGTQRELSFTPKISSKLPMSESHDDDYNSDGHKDCVSDEDDKQPETPEEDNSIIQSLERVRKRKKKVFEELKTKKIELEKLQKKTEKVKLKRDEDPSSIKGKKLKFT